MSQLYDVFFVSSNIHKYNEVKKILNSFGIKVGFLKCKLAELQSDSLKEISIQKALDAFSKCRKPVIVEDDGLFVNELGGFPGPFSSYVFKTIGNKGILQLVKSKRKAKFQAVVVFCDKNKKPIHFEANVYGTISKTIQGGGWGYDPIFVPDGKNKTFAQLKNKNEISHRYKALKKFSSWFQNKKRSIYQ